MGKQPMTFVWLLVLVSFSPVSAQELRLPDDPGALAEVASTSPEAQEGGATAPEPWTYDRVWRFADWYRSDVNPVVNRVQFSGRFQVDFNASNGDRDNYHEWNVRRFRFGAKTQLFSDFTLHTEAEFNPQEADPFYMRLTDTYLQWSRSSDFELTIGKHSAPFTVDGATSSKELLAIDRSNLTNNIWFTQEYFPGVSVAGEPHDWRYHAGLYSSGGRNREFGDFSGSVFFLGVVGYDFADRLDVEEAVLAANYVYNKEHVHNTFTRDLEQLLSVNLNLDAGGWGLRADVSTAAGYLTQSDVWGVMVMPFADLTDKLQLVTRYTYVASDDVNGVRLARYESQFVSGRGDRYHEGYVGANYYLYGHKLKLQSGVQIADLADRADDGGAYTGVSWTNGLRVSW